MLSKCVVCRAPSQTLRSRRTWWTCWTLTSLPSSRCWCKTGSKWCGACVSIGLRMMRSIPGSRCILSFHALVTICSMHVFQMHLLLLKRCHAQLSCIDHNLQHAYVANAASASQMVSQVALSMPRLCCSYINRQIRTCKHKSRHGIMYVHYHGVSGCFGISKHASPWRSYTAALCHSKKLSLQRAKQNSSTQMGSGSSCLQCDAGRDGWYCRDCCHSRRSELTAC